MKKRKSFILFVIVVAICTIVIQGDKIAAKSIKDLEKEISELEKEQQLKKSEQEKIKGEKTEVEQKMNENLSEQEVVQQQLDNINQQLEETEQKISEKETEIQLLEEAINELETEIEELEVEIAELEERIETRTNLLKDRLRSIQENGGMVQYVSVILGSETFSDLISRSATVSAIMDQDKNIVESLANDQQELEEKLIEVEEKKNDVEAKKEEQEEEKGKLDRLKELLDEQKKEQARLLDILVKAFDEMKEHSLSLEEEEKIIADQAAALEKAKELAKKEISEIKRKEAEEEARRKAAEEAAKNSSNNSGGNISAGGNGLFEWPLYKYDISRISSEFNPYRKHPIYGDVRPHNGMDIASPSGKPVLAAQSGVVSTAEYNPCCGLGNHIVVTHFINGMTYATVYGHLSSINVSQGDVVTTGQVIGNVGSTGASTGPHLHFEVHEGGYKSGGANARNPRRYLP